MLLARGVASTAAPRGYIGGILQLAACVDIILFSPTILPLVIQYAGTHCDYVIKAVSLWFC